MIKKYLAIFLLIFCTVRVSRFVPRKNWVLTGSVSNSNNTQTTITLTNWTLYLRVNHLKNDGRGGRVGKKQHEKVLDKKISKKKKKKKKKKSQKAKTMHGTQKNS